MIAQGTYKAKASGGKIDWVKAGPPKNTPAVHARFLLLDGPDGTVGQSIDWYGWITDKTSARVNESLTAMGYDGDSDTSCTKEIEVVIDHEEYEGKTRARVAFVNDPGRVAFERLSPADATGIKTRLRAAAAAAKANAVPREDDPGF